MSIRAWFGVLASASVVMVGLLASNVQATVIADWEFSSSAGWLTDSSRNDNTLISNGNVAYNATNGSAVFSGTGILSSTNAVDLTSYTHIRVSWSQLLTSVNNTQIIWEQSTNYGQTPGRIVSAIDNSMGSQQMAGLRGPTTSNNIDAFAAITNKWEHFAVEYDLEATDVSDIVKVYKDGSLSPCGIPNGDNQSASPSSFVSDKFYIGARSGLIVPVTGEIGYLKIETVPVPEPGTCLLGAMGVLGLLAYAWRRRK